MHSRLTYNPVLCGGFIGFVFLYPDDYPESSWPKRSQHTKENMFFLQGWILTSKKKAASKYGDNFLITFYFDNNYYIFQILVTFSFFSYCLLCFMRFFFFFYHFPNWEWNTERWIFFSNDIAIFSLMFLVEISEKNTKQR